MKRRLSFVCALACALALVMGLTGCGASEEYKPKTLEPTVSTPVIGVDGTLRVGVDADGGAPFVIAPEEGDLTGLDIDFAAALANQLGLKLEVVDITTDAATALEAGEVDVVMGMTEADASDSIWVSEPYVQTGVVLFSGSEDAEVPAQDSNPLIAVQSSSTSAWAVENAFGDSSVVPSGDLMSAFSSIETDEADYVAADAVIGTYAALYQNVDVTPIALLGATSGYSIGVSASNADLQTAVSEALVAATDNGVLSVVSSKWLGEALDFASLTAIDVSTVESTDEESDDESDEESSEDGETEEASADAEESTAGANAVLPGSVA